jgi:hypothetical protein
MGEQAKEWSTGNRHQRRRGEQDRYPSLEMVNPATSGANPPAVEVARKWRAGAPLRSPRLRLGLRAGEAARGKAKSLANTGLFPAREQVLLSRTTAACSLKRRSLLCSLQAAFGWTNLRTGMTETLTCGTRA